MSATADPAAPASSRLRVGDWTVEPALFQLSTKGKTVKLEPKAMAVLVYLGVGISSFPTRLPDALAE